MHFTAGGFRAHTPLRDSSRFGRRLGGLQRACAPARRNHDALPRVDGAFGPPISAMHAILLFCMSKTINALRRGGCRSEHVNTSPR
jgi:hypothetical protein